jgi:predicted transcriptional regulator
MRPIVSEQDPLRYPLNELLGTKAHVRLLRVMTTEVDGSLTVSDVAQRAGLTVPGAQKALDRLFRSGFISRVGGGRKHQYEIRFSDQLMQVTCALFKAERERYEQLLSTIKIEMKVLIPHPHAAWIQTFPRKAGEPLTLGLLHETRHLTNCVRHLRKKLNQLENDFNLTIELEGYTKADILDLNHHEIVPLYGIMPSLHTSLRQQKKGPSTHRESERRMLALSRELAKAILKDTSLLRRAKNHINRLLQDEQGTANRDLMEWRDILDMYSIRQLSQFFTSPSERANRLRQSNPFFAILTADERAQLTNDMESGDDT